MFCERIQSPFQNWSAISGERTSWVILLTDLNSRIPVTIQPGNAQAIMAGDNSLAQTIEILSQGTQLNAGDQVVTSGDGGILPAGLPVGIIVAERSGYRVALFAEQSSAQDVQILDFKQPQEQPPAPSPNDLPVTAAGLPPAAPPPPVAASPAGPQGAAPKPVAAKPIVKPVQQGPATATPADTDNAAGNE